VISGVKPTAPFHVNIGPVTGFEDHGDMPLVAPSVVAGSPRSNGEAQLVVVVLPVVVTDPGQPG
jgi:hypothetical protein